MSEPEMKTVTSSPSALHHQIPQNNLGHGREKDRKAQREETRTGGGGALKTKQDKETGEMGTCWTLPNKPVSKCPSHTSFVSPESESRGVMVPTQEAGNQPSYECAGAN